MKIGCNVQIVSALNTGVGVYADNIIRNLLQLPSPHEYYIFGNRTYLQQLPLTNANLIPTGTVVKKNWQRILWEQVILPQKISRNHIDLMFYPDHTSSLLRKKSYVIITIHDLSFLAYPKTFPATNRIYKSLAVKYSASRADKIIVDSQATKIECLRLLNVPESKIKIVYNGIDSCFQKIDDETRLEKISIKFNLPQKFILFVGTLEPRKNVVRLVEAYSLLRVKKNIEHQLIIVGGKGWLFEEIFKKVNLLSLQNNVRFLGYIAQDDLVGLYNLADVFVYPSLYEGFGFPPLEAMACGCPVVTSNVSSLPEVVGNAGLLVNCQDSEALAQNIFHVITDEDCRRRLIQRGVERVQHFSWHKSAKELLQVFNSFS